MNILLKSKMLISVQLFTFWEFTQAVHTSSLILFPQLRDSGNPTLDTKCLQDTKRKLAISELWKRE